MKVLSLNCQRGYTSGLKDFFRKTLETKEYDFLLLQEFAKEAPSFVEGVEEYSKFQVLQSDVDQLSQTCILHRDEYKVSEYDYVPFAKMRKDPVVGFKHSTFGSLLARFETAEGPVVVGSVHLHSGIDFVVRARQIERIKRQLAVFTKPTDRVVFGGDCNFGFLGERRYAEGILTPEFRCVTGVVGPTLDGRYSENVPHLPNRIAAFLGSFGITVPLSTDHMFADTRTANDKEFKARVLPDRVSDHSPVELML